MLNALRRYRASCALDRARSGGGARPAGEFGRVHELLSQREGVPAQDPSPALRSRIMEGLRGSPLPRESAHGWRWAMAAAACLALGALAVPLMRPAPRPAPALESLSGLPIPVGAAPVLRLVAGSVDRPLLDQAQKMYTDTRRATRAVVRCVPFARGG